jgi:hypothetical protein
MDAQDCDGAVAQEADRRLVQGRVAFTLWLSAWRVEAQYRKIGLMIACTAPVRREGPRVKSPS